MNNQIVTQLLILLISTLNLTEAFWPFFGNDNNFVDGKSCRRECDGEKINCLFNFTVETLFTMSKACFDCPKVLSDCYRPDCIVAGGRRRLVTVVNRQMPGPAIEACEGDRIKVVVENRIHDGAVTAIHWHGQKMKKSPYMDGVPWITQCPILGTTRFTYEFDLIDPGTMWWHSHAEMQRGDGVYGPLIVKQTKENNNHSNLYDFDLGAHVMMIGDWTEQNNLYIWERYVLGGEKVYIPGILVNGLGFQSNTSMIDTPLANFTVQSGFKYRFRVIGIQVYDCPIEISIDGHKMLIISLDSKDIEPLEVDSFLISSGERFDFILTANQPISTYYIRLKGYLQCDKLKTFTMAVLRYEESEDPLPSTEVPTYETAAPKGGALFNPISVKNATGYTNVTAIYQAKAVKQIDSELINAKNVQRFYVTLGMNSINHLLKHRYPFYGFYQVEDKYQARTPQLNHLSFAHGDIPLLPGRFQVDQKQFCNEDNMKDKNCTSELCACPYVYQVPKDAIVEFVFMELWDQDHAATLHPMHLHGFSFYVLAWQEVGRNITKELVMEMDKNGELKRNFENPPLKDSVTIPKGGYTIVRFKADNVGYWLLHCHVDNHSTEGMQLVLKVGEDRQMPNEPKDFPKCGSWPKK